jgi:hypothetical protein
MAISVHYCHVVLWSQTSGENPIYATAKMPLRSAQYLAVHKKIAVRGNSRKEPNQLRESENPGVP